MVTTLKAHKLTLNDAHQPLGFSPNFDGSFESRLILEETSKNDRATLHPIRDRIFHYLTLGQISEGQAQFPSPPCSNSRATTMPRSISASKKTSIGFISKATISTLPDGSISSPLIVTPSTSHPRRCGS